MAAALVVLKIVLAGMFAMTGGTKLAGAQRNVDNFRAWHYAPWFGPVVGGIELIGVAGLIVSFWVPAVGVAAALWLGGVMVGALYTHLLRAPEQTGSGRMAGSNVVIGSVASAALALQIVLLAG